MKETFDWNEWYLIITSSVILLLFFMIRKYFPLVMVIIIWVYNIAMVATVDYFLVGTPFKLYYFSDSANYDFPAALYHLIMYPCASLLFLFAYDKWKLYGHKTVWYILCWSGFAVFFEWITVLNHVLTYTGWKLYYSIPTYPVSAVLLIVVFRFTKKKLQELSIQQSCKEQ